MRRIAPRRSTALIGTLAMAGTAGLIALAPSASAASVDYRAHCTNPFLADIADGDLKMDIQVTPAKATYTVGDQVTVTWKWLKYGVVPVNTPFGIHVGENKALPKGEVLLTGAQTASVPVEGPRINPDAAPGEELKLSDMTTSITLTKPGTLNLAPGNYTSFVDAGLGSDVATACTPVTPVAPGTTINVEGSSTADPTVTATPGEVSAGGQITIAGNNWPAGTLTPELCAADGSACDAAKISGNTLAVGSGNKLAGTVTVRNNVAAGDYKVKVKGSGVEALSGVVKVKAVERKISLSVDHGPVGTTVVITGSGWTPGNYVLAYGMAGDVQDDDVSAYTEAAADGTINITDLVVSKDNITAIKVNEGSEDTTVTKPFRVTVPGRDLSQTVTGNVVAGGLTITQEAGAIKLSDITLNGQAQNMTGALNTVTVKDFRGGNTGWTLTGSVSDFTNGSGGKIGADKFTWTPKVTTGTGSPSTAVPGSTGPIGTGATLASAPAGASTGGTFSADADLSLAVPAYQAIGTYTSTLTLSIS
ncbi:hypothetical protein [Embleya sp. NPDC020630]|uniref:hypothetical protein n=1 Tax=Embleya sp. NPDC020630 TaxID=3363979 RepID=UPI0037A5B032